MATVKTNSLASFASLKRGTPFICNMIIYSLSDVPKSYLLVKLRTNKIEYATTPDRTIYVNIHPDTLVRVCKLIE